jgi:phage shock protein A
MLIFFLIAVLFIVIVVLSVREVRLNRRLANAKQGREEARSRAHAALDSSTVALIALRKAEANVVSQGVIIGEILASNARLEERLTVCQTEKYAVFNNLANVIAEKAEIEKQYVALNEQLKALVDQRRPRTVSHKPAKQQ